MQELTGDRILTIHRQRHLVKGIDSSCTVRIDGHAVFAARCRRSWPIVLRQHHRAAAAVLCKTTTFYHATFGQTTDRTHPCTATNVPGPDLEQSGTVSYCAAGPVGPVPDKYAFQATDIRTNMKAPWRKNPARQINKKTNLADFQLTSNLI